MVALLKTLDPCANELYRGGGLLEVLELDDDDKSVSLRRKLLMDYARFSRRQEEREEPYEVVLHLLLAQSTESSELRAHTIEYTEPHISTMVSPHGRTRW